MPTWARSASTASIGFALGPFTGLRLQDVYGDNAAWFFFAAVSVLAAATGATAVRAAQARRRGRLCPRSERDRPARRDPASGRNVEFRVWAPSPDGGRAAQRRDARPSCTRRAVSSRRRCGPPGRRLPLRARRRPRVPDPCSRFQPEGVLGPSRVVDLPRRRPRADLDELVVYELHVGDVLGRGHVRRRRPVPPRAARARRHRDRADAGRDLSGEPRLGLRRRVRLRAASGLRRPGRARAARRGRARRGARA